MKTKTRTWSIFESKIDGLWVDPIGLKLESPQSKKNAALIAAAPEMLAALEYLVKEVHQVPGTGKRDGQIGHRHINKAIAAINKAKGEV